MYQTLFIQSPIKTHLALFQFLMIMKEAAINIYILFYVWT